jgi:hypothetical protein
VVYEKKFNTFLYFHFFPELSKNTFGTFGVGLELFFRTIAELGFAF